MAKVIMTADDSASVRQMVSFTLKQAGYEVVEAVDGKGALQKLAGLRVDMLVTDLNMPNLDGIGLIKGAPALASCKYHPDHHADHRKPGLPQTGGEIGRSHRLDRQSFQTRAADGGSQEGARLRS